VIGGEGILEELRLAGITAFGGPVSCAFINYNLFPSFSCTAVPLD